ncbi:hypothetical protein Unana1_08823 [Umbelopsis nana]
MSDQDLKKLASDLLNSYSSYLNSPNLANLEHLNQYNSHLPLSWFTPQLLSVLQTHFNAGDPKVQQPIFGLWSTWIRRLVLSDGDLASAQQYLPFVITQFEQVLTTGTNVDSIKYALIAISCLTGVNIGETDDVQLGKQLAHAIPHSLTLPQDKDLHDTLDASLSYFIGNSTSPGAISDVLSSYVQSLGVQARRIFLMVENAADLRWRDKSSGKSLAVLWGALQTIHKNSSNKTASASAIAGLVRMLQFASGNRSKAVLDLEKKSEFVLCIYLNELVEQWKQAVETQEIIAAQDGLLTNPHTWTNGAFVRDIVWTSESSLAALEGLTSDPMFKDIGRLSRAIGKVIEISLQSQVKSKGADIALRVRRAIESLTAFSYNLYVDWDQCTRKPDYPAKYELPAANANAKPDAAERPLNVRINDQVWNVLKTVLFGFTTIYMTTAVDAVAGAGLGQVDSAAQHIVVSFANLNFITDFLGTASGFQAYQNTLAAAVTFLKTDCQVDALNEMMRSAFREYSTARYTSNNTLALTPVQQTRVLYFVDLLEQVVELIKDDVLENDILPVIYQLLGNDQSKALFESSHAVVLAIFEAKKPVSRELACVYAKILIDSYPHKLSHQQLRLAYTNMVQALCEIDDSVAWLTVNHLRQKIDHMEAKQVIERSQFLVTLIDQMKPISLGPFFGIMMNDIGALIRAESDTSAKALLKMVFETVSANGISDMRRVDAVGWYLQLKQDIEHRPATSKSAAESNPSAVV